LVHLSDFSGKKLILFFYPKDNTPGCTTEACNFRDNYESLTAEGFEVVGVSVDGESSHRRFSSKHNLPYTLLVDEDKKMVEDYKVWVEKSMFGKKYMGTARKTFIIDENGIILHIIDKVKTKEASEQVRALFQK
ncbi:MAG TPA: peroxiredoxin, partial [Sphingobacteriaceae bacterium]|nr:peroxiredoxin [Sphingobacteriaceae bacterium]